MGRSVRPKNIPLQEILFAAKIGFLSKRLWLDFFTKRSISQNSRLWRSFVGDEYFKKHESKSLRDVLVLDKKARFLLEARGLKAVASPHMNQVDHDEKVARILIQLEREKGIESIATESELKQRFMHWMRTTREGRGVKFPDLALTLVGTSKFPRIALEVELSKKNFDRCKNMMLSYSSKKDVDAVIFIAEQQAIFDRLARAMKDTNYPTWERPVGFSYLKDWLAEPTKASIYLSSKVATLQEWIGDKSEVKPSELIQGSHKLIA